MDYVKHLYGKLRRNHGNEKEFIRSKKPYYLTRLSFHRRYPRTFIIGGATLSMLILYSAPLYHGLFTKPEDITPDQLLWNEEKLRGKTHAQRWKEHTEEINQAINKKPAEKKLLTEQ